MKLVFKAFTILLLSLIVSNFSYSSDRNGTTGKIAGKITDAKDNSPLIGATVKVDGTNLGAVTDETGNYTILNVDVGTYSVTASYIGYKSEVQRNVKVSADITTTVNFALGTGEVTTEVIEITGKRSAISPDQSGKIIGQEFIENTGLRRIEDIASQTAGVVQDERGNNINIRGGRTSETAVIIDGVLTTNPLNGNSTAYVSSNLLQEMAVLTGGFSAEYGNVMSGVLNVTTKGGQDYYSGNAEVISDIVAGKWINTTRQGYNLYNFTVGGPLIPTKKLSKFINFYGGVERDYFQVSNPSWVADQLFDTGILPNFNLKRWSGNGKLNIDFGVLNKGKTPLELKLGTNISRTDRRNWVQSYMLFNSSRNPQTLENNDQYYAKINHNISSKFFYEAQFNYFKSTRIQQDKQLQDNFYQYGDPAYTGTTTGGSTVGFEQYQVFAKTGRVFNSYIKESTSYWEGNLAMTTQLKNHELKFGGNYKYHTIRSYNVAPVRLYSYRNYQDPDSIANVYNNILVADYYGYSYDGKSEVNSGVDGAKHPIIAAAYLQDKVEFKDFTLNVGLRLDYLDANSWRVKNLAHVVASGSDPNALDAGDFEDKSSPTVTVSPRLGFSFPVSTNTVFHAQYGKFIQLPQLQYLYVGRSNFTYWINSAGFNGSFGNPNLKPEKTTSYEVGIKQQIGDFLSMDLTAYYKETEDLIGIKKYPQLPNQIQVYENQDYGTIKGMDLALDLRRFNRLAVSIAYGLSYATGTGSDPNSAGTAAWLGERQPKFTNALDFDQRHTGSINVDYRFGRMDVPKGIWGSILSRFGVNFLYSFNSGRPYSAKDPSYDPFASTGSGAPLQSTINGVYGPWNSRLDMKVDKTISLSKLDLNLYVYVINLLNSRLVADVWESSGDPGSTGFLNTAQGEETANSYENPAAGTTAAEFRRLYGLRSMQIVNYGPPRQIRFGVKLNF